MVRLRGNRVSATFNYLGVEIHHPAPSRKLRITNYELLIIYCYNT
ncbi:hypothetical protein [Nostoc sp. NIES-3756]|nr:hypothetical protein [Nostoc sp. NIES-3756]